MTLSSNVQVTSSAIGVSQVEPSVAVNWLDTSEIVIGYINTPSSGLSQINVARSSDGGSTFSNTTLSLPTGVNAAGDPFIDYGYPSSYLLACHIFNVTNNVATNESIAVYKSVDGGQNFSSYVIVDEGYGQTNVADDKLCLAIDKSGSSQYFGNAYVAYTRQFQVNQQGSTGSSIFFQRSTDQGNTWSVPVKLTPDFPIGDNYSSVCTGPNGEIYVGWIQQTSSLQFQLAKSNDGGNTFSPTVLISNITFTNSTSTCPNESTIPIALPPWNTFRVLTLSFLAADISTGNYRGNVYAVWQDNHTPGSYSHIYLSRSTDAGSNWSAPTQVDDSPTASQNFFPYITVSPDDGTVYVIYYTNRAMQNTSLDVYVATSSNGGASFGANRRITTTTFSLNSNDCFIGDYISIAVAPGNQDVAVWTDNRTGNLNIFAGS